MYQMPAEQTIDLSVFYPMEELTVTHVNHTQNAILIKLKSHTSKCECSKCHAVSDHYHGTYVRKVQDLPILGKNVSLEITAHEYWCDNEACEVSTIVESFHGFLNYYSRMTERLEDFICTLALETSCEGCSRICKMIGIKISGDSVIRLLIKRYENQPAFECGDVIGVDDFAFKKRHTYGTIIVDENTHQTVAILEGRDGESLRQWLKNNKHVKTVTRDRASAYAKVIQEELPDAIQVADRFHLHQNLLEAIKKALNREIPATITIPHEQGAPTNNSVEDKNDSSKKNTIKCG